MLRTTVLKLGAIAAALVCLLCFFGCDDDYVVDEPDEDGGKGGQVSAAGTGGSAGQALPGGTGGGGSGGGGSGGGGAGGSGGGMDSGISDAEVDAAMDAQADAEDAQADSAVDGEIADVDAAPPITCDDLDCHDLAFCDESQRDAKCVCNDGYSGDGTTSCEDVNECDFATLNDCHRNAECRNEIGSYTCECNQGYAGDGVTCNDVDECDDDELNDCHADANCFNTTGSYTCSCKSGFDGDGLNCTDIDECDQEPGPCHPRAECENAPGTFTCTCTEGYDGDGFTCADIGECSDPSLYTCQENSHCVNTRGGYICECDPGYADDGGECRDLCDIAMADPGICDPNGNGRCHITPEGTAVCDSCKPGYTGNGVTCTREENCDSLGCDDDAICVTAGGLHCECAPGFEGDPLVDCTDIDECDPAAPAHSCDEEVSYCFNTVGGYMCVCNEGYEMQGGVCVAVDECYDGSHNCDDNALCEDLTPGYDCHCLPGFEGDGFTCTDIDECALEIDNCLDGYDICQNEPPGSFTCRDINECNPAPGEPVHNCDEYATCNNTSPGFTCTCNPGFIGDGTSCLCDLSGYWGMRQRVRIKWGDGAIIRRDELDTTVWELHKYQLNESTGDLEVWKKGCSQDDEPDVYNRVVREYYSSYIPKSVVDALPFWRGVDIVHEPASGFYLPSKPGDDFVTPTEAAVMGIDLGSDPVGAEWPTFQQANDGDMWVDMEGDEEDGLTIWQRNPPDYSYLPVELDGIGVEARSACVSTAARIKSWLVGELNACRQTPAGQTPSSANSTLIEGEIDSPPDATDALFRSCTLVPQSEWGEEHEGCDLAHWTDPNVTRCTQDHVNMLNDLAPSQEARACFELVKIAELSDPVPTCENVRTYLPPYSGGTCANWDGF